MNSEIDITALPVDKAEFSILDVETTGLSAQFCNIIEIGIVKVSKLKITARYSSFVNPGRLIPPFISNLTGITNEDVCDAPFFEEIAEDILAFIGDSIIVAHNLPFDKSFIQEELERCNKVLPQNHSLCTLKLARKLFPFLPKRSLASVAKHLNIHNSKEHRALSDAETTAKILIKIIKDMKEKELVKSVDDLLQLQFQSNLPKGVNTNKQLEIDLKSIPSAPGIYYFLNSKDEIIYVGKAKVLSERVKSYFSISATRKPKKIVKQAKSIKYELTNTELTALLTEAELIKVIDPKLNVHLKKYNNKYFLKIMLTQEFPSVEITNTFDFDGNDYFGLFISRRKANEILELVNNAFALRECKDKEFKKGRPCLLSEIERCTSACENKDKELYFAELNKVYEFLYGKSQFALNRLVTKMKDYSLKQKFEQAAEMKQLIELILKQTHKTSLLAEPVNNANVLFVINEGFGNDLIVMLKGKIYIKKYLLKEDTDFSEAISDYYENTLRLDYMPGNEDLEKVKITLNWLIRNRNKVKVYYLKDYSTKEELFYYIKKNQFKVFHEETVIDLGDENLNRFLIK